MIKNNIKLALNNRPPIEEFYREGIANNTIRYEEIPYARQKFFGTLIFGTIIILVFQYQVFPYVNSLSKNCQLWQGIDLTFILFYFIFVFPLFFAFLILFNVVKTLRYLNQSHETILKRTGYLNYRVYQKMTDKQMVVERLKLLFQILVLLIFMIFLISSAIKYNNGFFGMNTKIQHPLNPFNLKQNSQIMQQLCLAKSPKPK